VADNGKSLVTGRPEAVAGGEKGPGVVRSLPREDPLRWYDLLYREKVLKLLENALKSREDLEGVLETYLRRVNYLVPAKPKARDLLDALEAVDGWQSPRLALSLYLQKRGPLQAVKDSLGLVDEYREPVSDLQFLKELNELSLAEFLELVTNNS
jgi:hypothetical protein